MTIICEECGNEVSEGEALNGYCSPCVDKFERREEIQRIKKYESRNTRSQD